MLVKALRSRDGLSRYLPVGLSQLVPPYERMRPWSATRADCVPLGTIVHGSGPSALAIVGALAIALRSCPWLVPVVSLPSSEEPLEPLVQIVPELRDRVAVTHRGALPGGTVVAIVGAVRRRLPPEPLTMGRYCAVRCRYADLLEPLTEQFSHALGTAPATSRSVATYSRLFARHGRYTAHDWRALARLAYVICLPTRSRFERDDLEAICEDSSASVAGRTANRHARHFLAMSLAAARMRLGWEWILEHALRRGGYVSSRVSPL